MLPVRPVFPGGAKGALLNDVIRRIAALPDVERIILFGSYAKGTPSDQSDVDLAVFIKTQETCLLNEYRQLCQICNNPVMDIQVQAFNCLELREPCGIMEEIVGFGVTLYLQESQTAEKRSKGTEYSRDGRHLLQSWQPARVVG